MAPTRTSIGFVGLGHMGGNMAARFLAAGYPVYGEERSREDAQHLVQEGLRWCDTPREVAEAADVVFTSVPDDRVLEERRVGAGRHPRRARRREDVGRHEHRQPGEKAGSSPSGCAHRAGGCSTRPSREASRRCSRER